MFKIGILLPGSTLYPSIGIDFLQGIKSCFKFYNFSKVDFQIETVGFGLKDDELYAAVEKLLLVYGVDVVLAYIGDHHSERLAPLFAAAGKLLIVTNAGANYPLQFGKISHTIFHSLNDCLCAFLTGKYAARIEGESEGIMATSFFDAGYSHTHAIANAFMTEGGRIIHNYVSHYRKEEFNLDPLLGFIKENQQVNKLLAIYSGDMARLFYEKMLESELNKNLQWYVSPMMFDRTAGDFEEAEPFIPHIHGYVSWVPELANEANKVFLEFYKKEYDKNANFFSLQSWESCLLIMRYLQIRQGTVSTENAINNLKLERINTPRGIIQLTEKGYILGPVHFAEASGKMNVIVKESIIETEPLWEEMCAQIPEEVISGWQNTYLCI